MSVFLFGAAGAISVLLLFIGGAIIGWKAHSKYTAHLESLRPAPVEHHTPTAEEMERFREDQEAFEAMLHYSPAMAYGIINDPLKEAARKET